MGKVRIYTDGAARGNPDGPGGYGVVLTVADFAGNESSITVEVTVE